MTTKQYIYSRTSTKDQNVEQQEAYLLKKWPTANTYTEQESGKTVEGRPVFQALTAELLKVEVDDNKVKVEKELLVHSISRLGRNAIEVLTFINQMRDHGIKVFVVDIGEMDVTHPMAKLITSTLATVAEMQRDEMLIKQRIGIERAKAEGKYKGKQVTDKTRQQVAKAKEYVDMGLSKEAAAKAVGIGVATLYRRWND